MLFSGNSHLGNLSPSKVQANVEPSDGVKTEIWSGGILESGAGGVGNAHQSPVKQEPVGVDNKPQTSVTEETQLSLPEKVKEEKSPNGVEGGGSMVNTIPSN